MVYYFSINFNIASKSLSGCLDTRDPCMLTCSVLCVVVHELTDEFLCLVNTILF